MHEQREMYHQAIQMRGQVESEVSKLEAKKLLASRQKQISLSPTAKAWAPEGASLPGSPVVAASAAPATPLRGKAGAGMDTSPTTPPRAWCALAAAVTRMGSEFAAFLPLMRSAVDAVAAARAETLAMIDAHLLSRRSMCSDENDISATASSWFQGARAEAAAAGKADEDSVDGAAETEGRMIGGGGMIRGGWSEGGETVGGAEERTLDGGAHPAWTELVSVCIVGCIFAFSELTSLFCSVAISVHGLYGTDRMCDAAQAASAVPGGMHRSSRRHASQLVACSASSQVCVPVARSKPGERCALLLWWLLLACGSVGATADDVSGSARGITVRAASVPHGAGEAAAPCRWEGEDRALKLVVGLQNGAAGAGGMGGAVRHGLRGRGRVLLPGARGFEVVALVPPNGVWPCWLGFKPHAQSWRCDGDTSVVRGAHPQGASGVAQVGEEFLRRHHRGGSEGQHRATSHSRVLSLGWGPGGVGGGSIGRCWAYEVQPVQPTVAG